VQLCVTSVELCVTPYCEELATKHLPTKIFFLYFPVKIPLIMKKLLIISILLLSLVACKKKGTTPEGPTDVRIKNLSDLIFLNVTVSTSEIAEDTYNYGSITNGEISDYFRFSKAYPKAEITADIDINGTLLSFSTGAVDYTYMQYLGQQKVTYEVYISSMNNHQLTISNVIPEEPL